MAHQIILQPDGKLAIYSSVVDDWIMSAATPEEVLDLCVESAADEARSSTQRIIDAVTSDNAEKVYHRFALTFVEANERAIREGNLEIRIDS